MPAAPDFFEEARRPLSEDEIREFRRQFDEARTRNRASPWTHAGCGAAVVFIGLIPFFLNPSDPASRGPSLALTCVLLLIYAAGAWGQRREKARAIRQFERLAEGRSLLKVRVVSSRCFSIKGIGDEDDEYVFEIADRGTVRLFEPDPFSEKLPCREFVARQVFDADGKLAGASIEALGPPLKPIVRLPIEDVVRRPEDPSLKLIPGTLEDRLREIGFDPAELEPA